MTRFSFAFMAMAGLALAPADASEPKPGDRTVPPKSVLADLGAETPEAEIARAATAAAAHPFGTAANPARVGGPEGERAYVARLRCGDGSPPQIGSRAPAGVGAYGSVVESVMLDCGSAPPGRLALVVDIYHAEHREDRAPAGLRLDPS